MLQDISTIKRKLSLKKSVFVYVTYENAIVFTGIIDFTGIVSLLQNLEYNNVKIL